MAFTMSGVEGGYDFNRFDLFEGKGKKKDGCGCKKDPCECEEKKKSKKGSYPAFLDKDEDDKEEGAEGVSEEYVEEGLDPVGKEDGDVDNDGDKDSSDKYLLKRRKAIAKAMKKEEAELEMFTETELDLLEELLGKSERLDEAVPAVIAGAAQALGGVAKAGAKSAGKAAKGIAKDAAKDAAKGAVRSAANRAQRAIQGDQEDVEEGYKPVPFEKMERQSGKAYKKEQEAVRKGDEEEANKQMRRRVAMKSPLGRRQELLKKNARSKPMGEAYEEMYAEVYKGKHGMSDKEYQDARSDAGKRISGDSKEGPASYATRIHKNSPPTAPGEKPKNVPGLSKAEREELKMRKANLKKEDLDVISSIVEDKMDDFLAAMKKKHGLMDKSETDAIKKKKKEEKPTEAQLKQRKEGMKKLGDRRYFDSPRD